MHKELPVRKDIRLKGYDYSNAGYYFITICVKDNRKLFWENAGNVGAAFCRTLTDDAISNITTKIKLSKIGHIVDNEIKIIETVYDCVNVDKYVIMPNHIHMIIKISNVSDENPIKWIDDRFYIICLITNLI